MVEVEAIGELVSSFRRDPFLDGVSVTTCSREVSNVRGRIGEEGRSKRGGFEFGSESGSVFSIRMRPWRKRTAQGLEEACDTQPGIERCLFRQCQRYAEGCRCDSNGETTPKNCDLEIPVR